MTAAAAAHAVAAASAPTRRLVREHIRAALYDPAAGYFAALPVIAAPAVPRPQWRDMLGRSEYRAWLAAAYAAAPHGWLTPVEIFAPQYSQAVASAVLHGWRVANATARAAAAATSLSSPSSPLPLRVVEIGGGSGTHACAFLDAVAATAPAAYATMRYEVWEVSSRLREAQTAAFAAARHGGVARSLPIDASTLATAAVAAAGGAGSTPPLQASWRDATVSLRCDAAALRAASAVRGSALPDHAVTFVVALEVLDNQPLDKVAVVRRGGGGGAAYETYEAVVAGEAAAEHGRVLALSEQVRPLSDPWIVAALQMEALAAATRAQRQHVSGGDAPSAWRRVAAAVVSTLRAVTASPRQRSGRVVSFGAVPHGEGAAAAIAEQAEAAAAALAAAVPLIEGDAGVGAAITSARYVPTGTLQLLAGLRAALPAHRLLAADFHALPPPSPPVSPPAGLGRNAVARYIVGDGAPLVASKVGGRTVDHAAYAAAPFGVADVFASTDFDAASAAYEWSRRALWRAGGASSLPPPAVMSQAAFLRRYGAWSSTATLSGYNPMLQDFDNASVLMS